MNKNATHLEQVVHRTCAACGHVTHYHAHNLSRTQLAMLEALRCEECGKSNAVIMMCAYDPGALMHLTPLPG